MTALSLSELCGDAEIIEGDCLEALGNLANSSIGCCVTSPPYWGGLRDYGNAAQLGLHRNPYEYVDCMVSVFSRVADCLSDDGSLWLNLGDVYAASGKGGGGNQGRRASWSTIKDRKGFRMPPDGYKMKDLTLVAFQVAAALREAGWFLRSTIVWQKPSAVEPLRLDRPAVSHEYIFLFTKSKRSNVRNSGEKWWGHSVWEMNNDRRTNHPASFPLELARRCIISTSAEIVIDPFMGSGSTGVAALQLGRRFIGIELNPDYVALARERLNNETLGTQP